MTQIWILISGPQRTASPRSFRFRCRGGVTQCVEAVRGVEAFLQFQLIGRFFTQIIS